MAMLLVALFKLGVPTASSALIALMAFVSGQVGAVLVVMADTGITVEQKPLATIAVTGILAAAAAAGISRTDQSAENKRVEAGAKEPPKV